MVGEGTSPIFTYATILTRNQATLYKNSCIHSCKVNLAPVSWKTIARVPAGMTSAGSLGNLSPGKLQTLRFCTTSVKNVPCAKKIEAYQFDLRAAGSITNEKGANLFFLCVCSHTCFHLLLRTPRKTSL